MIPSFEQRKRIARGLIYRLDDTAKEEGAEQQDRVAELLVPFAVQCVTFLLARSDTPPKLEVVDLARMAVVQRMLNALPISFGLVRQHFYVEAIAASRPLLESSLLLQLFGKVPARAQEWFDNPETFLHLGTLRKEIGQPKFDPVYSWSSEHGEHVTAAAFQRVARASEETKSMMVSFGGAFDANLQAQTLGVLLMSAGEASGALVDTFLRDLPRLSKRGQSAFVQLMKTGRLDDPRRDAITFVSGVMHEVTDAKQLLEQIESASAAYVKEAQGLEKAGIPVPQLDVEF